MPLRVSPIPWYVVGRHQFDKGPSDFDHGHRVAASFVWSLPAPTGMPAQIRWLARNWRLNGLFSAQTGGPLTVGAGVDRSRTGLSVDRAVLVDRQVYGPGACGSNAPCLDFLNPSAFVLPAIGTFGNLGKGALRGPGQVGIDIALSKELNLRPDRYRIQFRMEFFNLLNHVNPGSPNLVITGAGFGAITSTATDPRIGQAALKVFF